MTSPPRVFVSHSHEDKEVATRLATALRGKGVDAWFDTWEIQPGDSLIQKIFEEGLKNCSAFVILLSPTSIESPWVKHELDVALIQRLEGTTRVIPVIVKKCSIPVPLRPLLWLDITKDFDEAVDRMTDVAFGRHQKPPLGPPPGPEYVINVPGLDRYSAAIAILLFNASTANYFPAFDGPELARRLKLTPKQINDAIDDLESRGLVRVHRYLGTSPFSFGVIEPTYALALQLRGSTAIHYDPEQDIKMVAATVAALDNATGEIIAEHTSLSPLRINNAAEYLKDYGIVEMIEALGTSPFSFYSLQATAKTRRYVAQKNR